MTPVFVIAGALAACAAAVLARAVLKGGKKADRPLAIALVITIPVLSLGVYLFLGSPGLPGRGRTAEEMNVERVRNNVLLTLRPVMTLKTVDPEDVGAYMVLGEISRRFGHGSDTVKFYARALELADVQGDPRAVPIAETLGQLQVDLNGGRVGDDARWTFKYILRRDPGNAVAKRFLSGYAGP